MAHKSKRYQTVLPGAELHRRSRPVELVPNLRQIANHQPMSCPGAVSGSARSAGFVRLTADVGGCIRPAASTAHPSSVARLACSRDWASSTPFRLSSHVSPRAGDVHVESLLIRLWIGDVAVVSFSLATLGSMGMVRDRARKWRQGPRLAEAFDPRDNALNFLRLCLAGLAVTSLVIAPLAWLVRHDSPTGFWTAPCGPFEYLLHNGFLIIRQSGISGTPAGVPYPGDWNLPLWTLFWEACCYAGLLVLGILGILRDKRAVIVWLFALFTTAMVAHALAPAAWTPTTPRRRFVSASPFWREQRCTSMRNASP